MKILLAYDGSNPAEAAVDEVVRRPWPAGSQVRLVTVIEPLAALVTPDGAGIYVPVMERIRASLREKAYDRVHGALTKLQARTDLESSCEVREGGVTQSLLDAIREWGADLVVAGSSGKSGAARLLLGSVSHGLVTHAPCSVEIVRTPVAA
jgi:nucleotide-binding universal stress UspA family protein